MSKARYKPSPNDFRKPDEAALQQFSRPDAAQLATMAALVGVAPTDGTEGTVAPAPTPEPQAASARVIPLPIAEPGIPSIDEAPDLERLRPGMVANVAQHLVVENKYNARFFYLAADVDRTAASLTENKQLAIATGWVESGKIRLKDGQMRWRGGRAGGLPYLKIEIIERPEPLDAYLSSREMNTARSEQTCLDDAVRWRQLLAEGLFQDLEHIAAKLKISVPNVSKVLSIANIPEQLLLRMREHKATTSLRVAYEIARLFSKDPANSGSAIDQEQAELLAADVIDQAIKKDLSGDAVRQLIESRRAGPKRRARSEIREVHVGAIRGQLKVLAEKGRLEFSISGLDADTLSTLTKAIEAATAATA